MIVILVHKDATNLLALMTMESSKFGIYLNIDRFLQAQPEDKILELHVVLLSTMIQLLQVGEMVSLGHMIETLNKLSGK